MIDAPGPVLMGVEDLSIPLEAQVFMGTIGVRPKCLLEKITQVWGLRYIVVTTSPSQNGAYGLHIYRLFQMQM